MVTNVKGALLTAWEFRRSFTARLVVFMLACTFGTPASGATNFDGTWSVVIVTERGDCDRAYRYPIKISNGTFANAGASSFDISGRVSHDGSLIVRVSHGNQSATGAGRLSADSGSGSWRGGSCAGSWTAERRATRQF